MAQAVPFQVSARLSVALLAFWKSPTAVQWVGVVQSSALSTDSVAPFGTGVDWTFQLVASHFSASALVFLLPSIDMPTAMHIVVVRHWIPLRTPPTAFAGSDGPHNVHIDPSHTSAIGTVFPPESVYEPTATQSTEERHETAFRPLLVAYNGSEVESTVQVAPFHCSASRWAWLVLSR
jgi:hypothetical protein